MNPEDNNYIRIHKKAILTITALVLVIGAGLLGWWIGRSDSTTTPNSTSTDGSQSVTDSNNNSAEVGSLVSYTLPDGWEQNSCEGSGAIYITPNGTTADCGSNPVAPIKISVDAGNNKDCNQLQNVTDVKKHVCISLYINGHKSLKASTEYLASSSYGQPTTINAYYIDTGTEVIKAEYIYNNDNQYQAGFDQLANSINTKN